MCNVLEEEEDWVCPPGWKRAIGGDFIGGGCRCVQKELEEAS